MYYFGLYFFSTSLWKLGALINDSDFEVKVSDNDISIIQVNTENKNKRCDEELDETTKSFTAFRKIVEEFSNLTKALSPFLLITFIFEGIILINVMLSVTNETQKAYENTMRKKNEFYELIVTIYLLVCSSVTVLVLSFHAEHSQGNVQKLVSKLK